jgi:hypothetical protein
MKNTPPANQLKNLYKNRKKKLSDFFPMAHGRISTRAFPYMKENG